MGAHRISLELSPDRLRLLREIQSFIAAIHHRIDPDMFSIEPAHVSWLERLVEPDVDWLTVALSRDELFALEIMVAAAWEYSLRTSTVVTLNATEDDLRELDRWISDQYQRFTVTHH